MVTSARLARYFTALDSALTDRSVRRVLLLFVSAIALLAVLLGSAAVSAAAEPLPPAETPAPVVLGSATVQARAVSVRQSPDAKAEVVSAVLAGDVLEVIGKTDGCSWLQVMTSYGATGWLPGTAEVVALDRPCAELAAFATEVVATAVPSVSPPITDRQPVTETNAMTATDQARTVPQALVTAPQVATVQSSSLVVRTEPADSAGFVTAVIAGDELAVLDQVDECAWLQVITPYGATGWVPGTADVIALDRPCAEVKLLSVPPATPTAPVAAEDELSQEDAQRNELAERIAAYTRAIALAPDDPEAYYERAWLYAEQGDYVHQIDDLTQALQLLTQPGANAPEPWMLAELYEARAWAYEQTDDLAAMVADLEQLLAINPWQPYGWAYGRLHSYGPLVQAYQAAVIAWEDARREAASEAGAAYDRGMDLLLEGRYLLRREALARAVDEFTAALTADPEFAAAYHMRALARLAVREITGQRYTVQSVSADGGESNWTLFDNESGETLSVSDEEYDRLLAEEAAAIGALLDAAQSDLEAALRLELESAELQHDLGLVHYWRWRTELSYDLPDSPGNASPHDVDELAAALPYFDQAVALAPDWTQAHFSRAMAYFHWAELQTGSAELDAENLNSVQQAQVGEWQDVIVAMGEKMIAADASDPRGYFMRVMAQFMSLSVAGATLDATQEAQLENDFMQATLLSGVLSPETLLTEMEGQVVPSGAPLPVRLLTSGTLELSGEQAVYVNRDFGFRLGYLAVDIGTGGVTDMRTAAGVLAVTAVDIMRQYELRVVKLGAGDGGVAAGPTTAGGELDLKAWIMSTVAPFFGAEDAIEVHDPIATSYGDAVLFTTETAAVAALAVDDTVYLFLYSLANLGIPAKNEVVRMVQGFELLED